jgi:uncharacterized membrane protein (Fun14 family)
VNWKKIGDDASKALDADHDGKLTINDFKILQKKYFGALTSMLPSSAGFGAAFYMGFKWR